MRVESIVMVAILVLQCLNTQEKTQLMLRTSTATETKLPEKWTLTQAELTAVMNKKSWAAAKLAGDITSDVLTEQRQLTLIGDSWIILTWETHTVQAWFNGLLAQMTQEKETGLVDMKDAANDKYYEKSNKQIGHAAFRAPDKTQFSWWPKRNTRGVLRELVGARLGTDDFKADIDSENDKQLRAYVLSNLMFDNDAWKEKTNQEKTQKNTDDNADLVTFKTNWARAERFDLKTNNCSVFVMKCFKEVGIDIAANKSWQNKDLVWSPTVIEKFVKSKLKKNITHRILVEPTVEAEDVVEPDKIKF